jgi:hypothetical protein
MVELIKLKREGLADSVATRPVSLQEYRAFLRATGQPMPQELARVTNANEPVVYVSQVAGLEYCHWLGAQYRLPSVAELLALMGPAGLEGTSKEMWPHTRSQWVQRGATYLCEWTRDSQTLPPASGGEPRVLASVFYPPWLRHGNSPKEIEAMMLASQGYSFVSFRVACA